VDPRTVTTEAFERVALADPVRQADRRARPLARRFLSTARPARVLIRARKPCLRARRRLLGWNVRFKRRPPRRPGHNDQAGWASGADQARTGVRTTAHPDRSRLGVLRSAWQPGTLPETLR
jgi:hypothetical protein